MVRPPSCGKLDVKRGLWTAEEDAKTVAYVSKHGIDNWTLLPKKAGLNRCGKSCRLRWTNYLRPALKHHNFTPQEEDLIVKLHKAIGSRWSLIAKELPGRTDNDVKNYWNTKLRKKLTKMGIDPVTHKPYSQILTEHGNISGLPNTATPMGSFSGGGLNNTSVSVSGLSYTNNIDDLEPLVEQFQAQLPSTQSLAMVRPPSCDKLDVKRGLWTAEEDAKTVADVSKHGIDNWTLLPKKAGLNRCGKSCRLRWTNYLRPALKHHNFTPQEEDLIVKLHKAIGSRWSLIAKELPGRTDNDVKNYWNTKLRKKLTKMGIDPVTHKPYSQILTEDGNISGLPNTATSMGSFSGGGLNNTLVSVSGLSYTNNIDNLEPLVEQFQVLNLNQETVRPTTFLQ